MNRLGSASNIKNIVENISSNRGGIYVASSRLMSNDLGSGSGRGGGAGGSVRQAGGSMGKKGATEEELYFNKQNRDMKEKLKQHLNDEIKKHEEAIKASKELLKDVEK